MIYYYIYIANEISEKNMKNETLKDDIYNK